jgi:hypothetical protein
VRFLHVWAPAVVMVAAASLSCEVGQGAGSVRGNLHVEGCDKDLSNYDMAPDFFAGNAAETQLMIRIQRGGDLQEYNDSLNIIVDDTNRVQDGQAIEVKLMRPPGSAPSVEAPPIRISLSLRGTCGTGRVGPRDPPQVVLHAISGTITFKHILRGDPSSEDTNSKRIEGSFNVTLEDPRHAEGTPARNAGTLTGDFKFFYQRGGPAQPFP